GPAPAGRPQAAAPVVVARRADRAAAARPEPGDRRAAADERALPTARAAARARRVEGVERPALKGALGLVRPGVLGNGRLRGDDRTRLPEARHHGCVFTRHVALPGEPARPERKP